MHGDAGESEYAVLPCVVGGAADNNPVMAFEVFGKDIRIKESFGHPLERGGRPAWAASFFVCDMDNFIDQGGIGGAAEQPKPLFENGRAQLRRVLRAVLVKPGIQLRQLLRRERINGAFDILQRFQFHESASLKFYGENTSKGQVCHLFESSAGQEA
jgi:hypothetical protein